MHYLIAAAVAEAAEVSLDRLVTASLRARLAKADYEIKERKFLAAKAEADENRWRTPQPWEFGLAESYAAAQPSIETRGPDRRRAASGKTQG